MSESGFASLGPSLLARKGGAKPAMRPQVAPLVAQTDIREEQLEDLGWNDMGHDNAAEPGLAGGTTAEIVPIHADIAADAFAASAGPIVRRQQRRLEERVLADAAMTGAGDDGADHDEGEAFDEAAPAPRAPRAARAPAAPRPCAAQAARRAAFTLRLDADRHLKLRLAATMQNVSAQALVTEALDRLLAGYDELDVIASHLKRH